MHIAPVPWSDCCCSWILRLYFAFRLLSDATRTFAEIVSAVVIRFTFLRERVGRRAEWHDIPAKGSRGYCGPVLVPAFTGQRRLSEPRMGTGPRQDATRRSRAAHAGWRFTYALPADPTADDPASDLAGVNRPRPRNRARPAALETRTPRISGIRSRGTGCPGSRFCTA